MSAPTVKEITSALNKELQMVFKWVSDNKLVLNISKTKSIVFETKHSLSSKPQLNLVLNKVAVEQVQETKLLGVTLDSKLSWSRHIDLLVQKMGRNISVVKRCFFNTSSVQTGSADPCIVTIRLLLGSLVRYNKNKSREASTGTKQSS